MNEPEYLEQLSLEQVQSMSPDDIATAKAEGRLNALLGRTIPTVATPEQATNQERI